MIAFPQGVEVILSAEVTELHLTVETLCHRVKQSLSCRRQTLQLCLLGKVSWMDELGGLSHLTTAGRQ